MNDGINLTPPPPPYPRTPQNTSNTKQLGPPGAVHARARPAHAAGRGVCDGEDGAGGADDVPALLQVGADWEMDWGASISIDRYRGWVRCLLVVGALDGRGWGFWGACV